MALGASGKLTSKHDSRHTDAAQLGVTAGGEGRPEERDLTGLTFDVSEATLEQIRKSSLQTHRQMFQLTKAEKARLRAGLPQRARI